jgi:hypothetical protein
MKIKKLFHQYFSEIYTINLFLFGILLCIYLYSFLKISLIEIFLFFLLTLTILLFPFYQIIFLKKELVSLKNLIRKYENPDDSKNKIALSSKIKAEKPEGVCWDNTRKKWVLSFKYLDKITIRKRYNNQQECEYHRDILFYYYTKNENPLNYYYPDNIEYYKKYNVLELLDSILPTKPNNTYRGVYKDNKCGKFIVRLVEHGGVDVYLGIYDSEDEAVLIHDKVVAFKEIFWHPKMEL